MRTKICGITNYEDAILAYQLGADALGFIFYKGSKRFIRPDIAKSIIDKLPPFISTVGVFINEEPDSVNKIADTLNLNYVQLHGDESPGCILNITHPVIKAFRVGSNFDFNITNSYTNCFFLFDTYNEELYGGTGATFDWNIIPERLRQSSIIAGGLSVDNIESLHNTISPCAVDVSSSLEKEPGIKDKIKMKIFFNKVEILRGKSC